MSADRSERVPTPSPREEREPRPSRGAFADARAAVTFGGPILFTPWVLSLAERHGTLFGVPSLALYVFLAWLVGIVLTAIFARRGG